MPDGDSEHRSTVVIKVKSAKEQARAATVRASTNFSSKWSKFLGNNVTSDGGDLDSDSVEELSRVTTGSSNTHKLQSMVSYYCSHRHNKLFYAFNSGQVALRFLTLFAFLF